MPGLNRCAFLTPPAGGINLFVAFVASCFLGIFPPVDFLQLDNDKIGKKEENYVN